MKLTIALLVLLISAEASADSVLKYGANVGKPEYPTGATKSIFLADQSKVLGPIITQLEAGGWFDHDSTGARRSSGLAGASLGVNVNAGYLFGQALVGPALITHTDELLGGHLQFNNDIAFGIRDPDTKATFGIGYKHVSSAGLASPNRGRDFLLFRVSLPW